jgi:thiamine-phosphate pyrophosphorylase
LTSISRTAMPVATPSNPRQGARGARATPARGLYAITNGPRDDLLMAVRRALDGGAALVQYRDKTLDRARRLDETCSINDICRRYEVPLIVNDDVELARASGAAGVHLGEDDPAIGAARAALGASAVIGVSCYDSLQRANAVTEAGADYLAFGAFFPTTSKTVTRHATPNLLHAAQLLGLPLVAIGGITPDNGAALIAAGADFLAAISGVFGAPDICAAAQRYAAIFARHC